MIESCTDHLTIIQVHEKSQRLTSGQPPEIENLLSKKIETFCSLLTPKKTLGEQESSEKNKTHKKIESVVTLSQSCLTG